MYLNKPFSDIAKQLNTIAETHFDLSKSDSKDPSKIYCNKVRRNPNNGHRSEFNADKTKLLRPSLYTYFSNDESISFCYYSDETMENDDETILKNFSSR